MIEEENEFWNRFAMISTSMTTPTMSPSSAPTFPCNSSPELREDALFAIAVGISSDNQVTNSSTPQGQALEWLVKDDPLFLCPDDVESVTQRYVMAVLYLTMKAVPSVESLKTVNECEWGGVTCTNGVVSVISIQKQPLGGTLPDEIGKLTGLSVFDIEHSELFGPIPSSIADIKNLLAIDLNDNKMTGSLPDSIYTLTGLQQLDLDKNAFTGTLSPEISKMTSLRFLQLEDNKFIGTIPDSLGDLKFLEQATFDMNDFTGTMPENVCEDRGDGTSGGQLVVLNADCPPKFFCDCCTMACK